MNSLIWQHVPSFRCQGRLISFADVEREIDAAPEPLVESLILPRSVNLAAGDSGIGKTPLLYQLAVCIATGEPFLGFSTRPGQVFIADRENPLVATYRLRSRLARFLGIKLEPDNPQLLDVDGAQDLADAVREHHPDLVIVDTLRMLDPDAERSNTEAGRLLKLLRQVANDSGTAFILLHHLRKPSSDPKTRPPRLVETHTLEWMLQVNGPRALVNQTDSRIATELENDGLLVLRTFARLDGEHGPVYVERVLDDDGEPLGFRRRTVPLNPAERADFDRLPAVFGFAEAKRILECHPQTLSRRLAVWQGRGLIRKEDGKYFKAAS